MSKDDKNYFKGVKKTGDECLEPLKKFGKIVGYIISGVIISIIFCCCICWCCVCKAIFSNKRGHNGQVFAQGNAQNMNNYNRNHASGNNATENSTITTIA